MGLFYGDRMREKFYLASDHGAYEEKKEVIAYLQEKHSDLEIIDLGTDSANSCNYAEFAIKLAKHIQQEKARGILFCGSGIGASIAANRFAGVRAALCRSVEEAKLSRLHNDANVLTMGGRITSVKLMKEMIDVWFSTKFESGRHVARISTFNDLGERA
jgi:ribose 5-phosphate isomerase B